MKEKIKAHLITLPRWFAAPAAICAVILGGAISGGSVFPIILATITGLLLMAAAHSSNTWLDFYWTRFDIGTEEERSRPKEYTVGQQPIAAGILSGKEVLGNILFWLVLSAIPASILSVMVSPWIWLFWGLTIACSPFYSWGKLHYLCELALGLGFGPIACCLGASASPNPNFLVAFLAGIPFLILWGFGAETIDQWTDAEPNWPRGLRNMGALLWKNNVSVSMFFAWLLSITFFSQLFLIAGGILAPLTALSLISFIPFSFCLLYLEKELKTGVLWGLLGIFLQMILLTLGQILGG